MEHKVLLIYFTPRGGMYEYAEMIKEGYIQNGNTCLNYIFKSPRFNFKSIFHILRIRSKVKEWSNIIKAVNSNIIHVTEVSIFLPFFLKQIYNSEKKYIITLHDPEPHPEKRLIKTGKYFLNKYITKQLIRASNKKPNIKLHIHSEGQKSKNLKNLIIGKHPIRTKHINYSEITKAGDNEKIKFLFIGRIEYYKGVDTFLQLASTLLNKYPKRVEFHLAGRGDIENIEKYHKEIKVTNRFLQNSEFESYIKDVHVIVLPYRQATQSGILNLALAMNKPVIAYKVGCLEDYILHNKTGILISDKSLQKLTEEVERIIADFNLIQQMSRRCITFKHQFSSKEVCSALLKQL